MAFAEGTPTAEIQLGGKSYTLGYTLGAMQRAKDLGVLKIDMEDDTAFMLALPAYVWSCLNEEGRNELSVEQLGELMNPLNARAVAEAMIALFTASLPKEDPQGNANPPAVKKPTGGNRTLKSSGQSAATTSG
jgi:hypothetical protein